MSRAFTSLKDTLQHRLEFWFLVKHRRSARTVRGEERNRRSENIFSTVNDWHAAMVTEVEKCVVEKSIPSAPVQLRYAGSRISQFRKIASRLEAACAKAPPLIISFLKTFLNIILIRALSHCLLPRNRSDEGVSSLPSEQSFTPSLTLEVKTLPLPSLHTKVFLLTRM